METKLWRIMHLSTVQDWDDQDSWDVMLAEECAIVECTEEQVKEMCAKAIPIRNKNGYVTGKFVYFEVKRSKTFDPIKWFISNSHEYTKTKVLDEAFKQLLNGTINSYKSDYDRDGCYGHYELRSDPDWNYKEELDSNQVMGVELTTSFDYIRGVEK